MSAHGAGQCVEAPGLGYGDLAAADSSRCSQQPFSVADRGAERRLRMSGHDPAQFEDRGRAHDAVGGQAHIVLEFRDGSCRVGSEDAVDPSGVEPEGRKTALELRHVVAAEHGLAQVQRASAELEAGFDEGLPGLWAADPVDTQATAVLKGLDSRSSAQAETAKLVWDHRQLDRREPLLEVDDRVAGCAETQGKPRGQMPAGVGRAQGGAGGTYYK